MLRLSQCPGNGSKQCWEITFRAGSPHIIKSSTYPSSIITKLIFVLGMNMIIRIPYFRRSLHNSYITIDFTTQNTTHTHLNYKIAKLFYVSVSVNHVLLRIFPAWNLCSILITGYLGEMGKTRGVKHAARGLHAAPNQLHAARGMLC